MVIHRRPHCSATKAVVPEPQVGSSTRSPGSVAMRIQRSMTFALVWTTYAFSSVNAPVWVSVHRSEIGLTAKSSMKRTYESEFGVGYPSLQALARRFIPGTLVFQKPRPRSNR